MARKYPFIRANEPGGELHCLATMHALCAEACEKAGDALQAKRYRMSSMSLFDAAAALHGFRDRDPDPKTDSF